MSMPVLFVGHGSPMNALAENRWSRAWAALGRRLPRPRAIVVVSAHWYARGSAVTAMAQPRTIHDFAGFPPALSAFRYGVRGDRALAERVAGLLAPRDVRLDQAWGIDHGAWSVLCHMFPAADVPVVELAIDALQPPAIHHELGRLLQPLRADDVLILGSGNVVHNLRAYAWEAPAAAPYDWALRFESSVRALLERRNRQALVDYAGLGDDARLAVPTPEHFAPLLYALGASADADALAFPVEGFDGGSISMLSVQFG